MNLADYLPDVYENNISKSKEVLLLKNSFGDGYKQTAPSGINHMPLTYSVAIPTVTRLQKETLDEMLTERGGYKNFAWIPAGDLIERLWTCEDWKFNVIAPDYFSFEFVLKENFALGEDI